MGKGGRDARDLAWPVFRRTRVSLQLFTAIVTLGTAQDVTLQDLRIETFFPVDDASAKTFRDWAA